MRNRNQKERDGGGQYAYISPGWRPEKENINHDEIVYWLKGARGSLMVGMIKQILQKCDDLIVERLSLTDLYPSKARKGLGRHVRKDDAAGRFCRGRKVHKMGYRKDPIKIRTVFGYLTLHIREVECCRCGARYSPLLGVLKIGPDNRGEMNFENEVIQSVMDTHSRKRIDWKPIDISLCTIHDD